MNNFCIFDENLEELQKNKQNQEPQSMVIKFINWLFSLILLFSGCSSTNKQDNFIYLLVNDVTSVTIGTKFIYKGLEVGVVEKQNIHNNKIMVVARFNSEFKIPQNSVFKITRIDILGNSQIIIEPQSNISYLAFGDTIVQDFIQPESISIDSVEKIFKSFKKDTLNKNQKQP